MLYFFIIQKFSQKSTEFSPFLHKLPKPPLPVPCRRPGSEQKTAPVSLHRGRFVLAVRSIVTQVAGGLGVGILAEVEVVAGQNGVEDDAGDGGDGQGGQAEGDNIVADADWRLSDGRTEGGHINAEAALGRDADGQVVASVAVDRSQLTTDGDVWARSSWATTPRPWP